VSKQDWKEKLEVVMPVFETRYVVLTLPPSFFLLHMHTHKTRNGKPLVD